MNNVNNNIPKLHELMFPVEEAAKRPADVSGNDFLLFEHRMGGSSLLMLFDRLQLEVDMIGWSSADPRSYKISRRSLLGYIQYARPRNNVARIEGVLSLVPGYGPLMYEFAMASLQKLHGEDTWLGSDMQTKEKARSIWDKFLAGVNPDIEHMWSGNISKQAIIAALRASGFSLKMFPNQLLTNPTAPLPEEKFMNDPELVELYKTGGHPGVFYVYKLRSGASVVGVYEDLVARTKQWAIKEFGDPPDEALETLSQLVLQIFSSVYHEP